MLEVTVFRFGLSEIALVEIFLEFALFVRAVVFEEGPALSPRLFPVALKPPFLLVP